MNVRQTLHLFADPLSLSLSSLSFVDTCMVWLVVCLRAGLILPPNFIFAHFVSGAELTSRSLTTTHQGSGLKARVRRLGAPHARGCSYFKPRRPPDGQQTFHVPALDEFRASAPMGLRLSCCADSCSECIEADTDDTVSPQLEFESLQDSAG